MIRQEADSLQLLNVNALLTPEQVAAEMLQAAKDGRTDVTLAPNSDIALALKLMEDDPDRAEQVLGKAHQRRIQQLIEQQG